MKKVLCLLVIAFTLITSNIALTNSYVTMYALDGRTISVPEEDINKWKAVGWYALAPVTMYALNGKEIKVPAEKVSAYEKVGWYQTPPATVYALDGRVKNVPQDTARRLRNQLICSGLDKNFHRIQIYKPRLCHRAMRRRYAHCAAPRRG